MKNRFAIGKQIRILANLLRRGVDNPQMTKHGLTGMQCRVIGFLFENRERDIFQRDVENEFSIRRSTATEILKLMQKNGLITKEFVGYDERLKKLNLTPKAVEIHCDILKNIKHQEEILCDSFTEEELVFVADALERMRQNLSAVG